MNGKVLTPYELKLSNAMVAALVRIHILDTEKHLQGMREHLKKLEATDDTRGHELDYVKIIGPGVDILDNRKESGTLIDTEQEANDILRHRLADGQQTP